MFRSSEKDRSKAHQSRLHKLGANHKAAKVRKLICFLVSDTANKHKTSNLSAAGSIPAEGADNKVVAMCELCVGDA